MNAFRYDSNVVAPAPMKASLVSIALAGASNGTQQRFDEFFGVVNHHNIVLTRYRL